MTDEDGASGTGSAEAASGWSRDPIDVSGLQAVDAEIALAAASVDLGLAQLGRTNILVTLDKGRAVTEIREIQAYDGTVTGTLVVNSRGGLSTRADLSGKGVRIKPLLVQLADWDRLQTTGDVRMNLLGVGNSVDALMNSLSGEGAIKFGQGEIAGLDLVGMLRNLDASYIGEGAKTIFESIGATFTVDQGVLTNADLAFLAPLITASGKGRIGLGAQTLDYRLEGQTGGGIRVPVLITGTWANPKFRLDLESLAEERIEVEVEKVKEQAEEAVIERLNEELGVDIQTKEDIDDVLKKELEERARDGLAGPAGRAELTARRGTDRAQRTSRNAGRRFRWIRLVERPTGGGRAARSSAGRPRRHGPRNRAFRPGRRGRRTRNRRSRDRRSAICRSARSVPSG